MGLSLLRESPLAFLLSVAPLLMSVVAHEIAHGWVALRFGDPTAKYAGRLTFNPIPHIDPVGAIMVMIFGFGWAKPVPVNFRNLKPMRAGIISVSLAGVITNILIATISIFLLKFRFAWQIPALAITLQRVFQVNILLGALNIIPIPPLDGSRVLMELLPYEGKLTLAKIEPYGFPIIILLLMTGILSPVIMLTQRLILGFISLFLGIGVF